MAIDLTKIQNANISNEDKKVLLVIAETMNEGLDPAEAQLAALDLAVNGDGEEDTGLVGTVTALDLTVNGDGGEDTGLVGVADDHETRIAALEAA